MLKPHIKELCLDLKMNIQSARASPQRYLCDPRGLTRRPSYKRLSKWALNEEHAVQGQMAESDLQQLKPLTKESPQNQQRNSMPDRRAIPESPTVLTR
ncbi:hypothetical protein CEXT_372951 [Caerostris extrusa]|uniref:Uncharacterized protein n=1 Tax=Caerostris extrusa TaxID=172846 RepID=A0AAV4UBP8_CAEEX|nr:hypothetical protein CEXT_372951 [Caerostris extrusa]